MRLVDPGDGPLAADAALVAARLAGETVASRIGEADPSVWGRAATDAVGWAALPRTSRPLVGQIAALRERFRVDGARRVVLVAAPGQAHGAAMLARASAAPLEVLDSADPGALLDVLEGDMGSTVIVHVDTAGQADGPTDAIVGILQDAVRDEGVRAEGRIVVVTEAGSRLEKPALEADVPVVTAERDVPSRFGTLGATALVAAGLAGVDVEQLLADATGATEAVTADHPDNPALVLAGLLLAEDGGPLEVDPESGPDGLAAWVEHLVGGSTGGLGPLPLLTPGRGGRGPSLELRRGGSAFRTRGGVGAQVVLWQCAVATVARVLGADPFAGGVLPAGSPEPVRRTAVDGDVEIRAGDGMQATSVVEALRELAARAGGAIAVEAWLDPREDASAAVLGPEIARRTGRPTTFGWAPHTLDGTGRHHRDTPDSAFLVITGDSEHDHGLPGGGGLDDIVAAQAAAATAGLVADGRPVLGLHLRDRLGGLVTLARAVQEL
ncbi:MAG: hypothetical protein J0I34_27395 [Pseudonocardia sp.]|uniref:hypothetical protein n=1 Tax=unclassified Pseudonocardia TaxID=2619320 RepID=UPI00086F347D|nr:MULTISPECIES: hypothetical protein [unclassified Pseudonocardia]MBN9112500.1 hypothetical protein [Pseudonocardia sp.]ODU06487.1 MAG: hypothetical protein ABS80_24505 [Pseudonocardia sp. SCN 72-51]ODV07101.1 MAG: hypothetical protein ABT15_10115 [Pseudonocardia sp. SCN 73-27]